MCAYNSFHNSPQVFFLIGVLSMHNDNMMMGIVLYIIDTVSVWLITTTLKNIYI